MDKATSLEQFYEETRLLIPGDIGKEIGHFNVFRIDDLMSRSNDKQQMPYNRRAYYKISLIKGRNRAEYADKTIEIEKSALLFATPKVPYNYVQLDEEQSGFFCIFTSDYLARDKSGIQLDDLPLFRPDGYPVFQLTDAQTADIEAIFRKMHTELGSDYRYKYDLLRNFVMELIHFGQKLQPLSPTENTQNAANRITSLFLELLERQFPIESPQQRLQLRAAGEYAERLAIHVNHLNQVLKETTGYTTTTIISGRIVKEAKILLKQTAWTVSEIAFSLGFGEVAHFSNFFKKHTTFTPAAYRK